MDDEISRLRRELDMAPADPAAAQRYESALRRAGRTDDVDALYRLTFSCPLRWDALEGGHLDTVRRCDQCKRDVYYVKTREDMARWVAEGACVALDPEQVEETFRVLVDAEHPSAAKAPGRPCVLTVAPGEGPANRLALRGRISPPRVPSAASRAVRKAARQLLRAIDARQEMR
ncbi:hypothetical protein OAX78_01985 [Planctomycetota bacterium]|nr:hypothetical protein [Planctomycetota bacterium]